MQGMQSPIMVMNTNTKRETGRKAQLNNIAAAKAVADIIRTTLGPRSMLKMILDASGGIVLTNDGNAILREIDVTHPAAKSMIELSRTQDEEVGDGTTSVIILAGEILHLSQPFLEKDIHPTVVVRAYMKALDAAVKIIDSLAFPIDVDDREQLMNIVTSCIGTKYTSRFGPLMGNLALDAVMCVAVDNGDGTKEVDIKEYFSFFVDCKEPKACSIILRGASRDVLNEVERNLHDAMGVARNVVHDPRLLPGGGAVEMAVSRAISEEALKIEGVEQWPFKAIGQALEVIPRTLAQNCGANVIRTLTKLRAKHAEWTTESSGGKACTFGIDGDKGTIVDMKELGVWEAYAVKVQSIKTAVESAAMLLRIDDIVSGLSQKGGPGAGAGTGTGVAPSQDDEEDPPEKLGE